MSNSLRQVEKQLAAIEQSSQVLADELQHTFLNYLKCLGIAVKKQLILASYYLCTQGYPDAFLSLSFKERQELQSAIRQNGLNAGQDLSILLTLTLRFQADLANGIETDDIEDDIETDDDDLEYLEDFLDETEAEGELEAEEQLDESNLNQDPAAAEPPQAGLLLKTPHRVSQWHKTLEQGIQEILRTVSRKTNKDLQSYKILPKNLPEIPDILLGIGLKNSRFPEPTGNLPNLANVTIELGDDFESENSRSREQKSLETMSILKIYLRLSDIEFADPLLMARRNQIRELSHRLDSLLKEFEKKQQERMIAEAEAAWRSSWFEE
jgi:hypothetical protein